VRALFSGTPLIGARVAQGNKSDKEPKAGSSRHCRVFEPEYNRTASAVLMASDFQYAVKSKDQKMSNFSY
jgi:hypothetical protein